MHLFGRAARLFVAYVAVLAAVVIAGFLAAKIGIWASILWGVALIAVVATVLRNRVAE